MPVAEIITIGTELLLGEIVDTNARYLALEMRNLGIDLYRKITVGDNIERIAQALSHGMERSNVIITTGGLGPTVDDPSRQAFARAMGVEIEFRPELWEQIQARFRRFGRAPTENNRRQAYVPQGAIAVENPVGTAPAFIMETAENALIALPGVPREMEYLMQNAVNPYLRKRFQLTGLIKTRLLHTAGVGESQIDDLIGDLEKLDNPTVGLSAHSGQVDVRITAKAGSENKADELIQQVETEIRERLGEWIYGADEESLEQASLRGLSERNWQLVVVEAGLGGELVHRLAAAPGTFLCGQVLGSSQADKEQLFRQVSELRLEQRAEVGLGVSIYPGEERQEIHLALITPEKERRYARPYGGPPGNASRWALHHSLDILRRVGTGETE